MEVVLSTAIMGTLMGGMISAIMISQHGINDPDSMMANTVDGRTILDQITSELKVAQTISDIQDTSITFTIPDRTGDGITETIVYTWSGTPGDALSRSFNGTTMDIIDDIHHINFSFLTRTLTAPTSLESEGLVAHWKLDSASGSSVIDSANSHDGTIIGATWTTGILSNALQFDGSGDYVLVPHSDELSLTDQFTFTAWIYIGESGLNMYDLVFNKGTSGSNWNYWFGTIDDEIAFGFYNKGYVEFNTRGVNLQRSTWYHIAASFDNSNDSINIYLNGSNMMTTSSTMSPLPNTEGLYIGTSQGGANWSGKLDDLRIYNKVLTETEIKAIYSEGISKVMFVTDYPIYTTPPEVLY